jgi:hypothetical protein
MGKGSTPKTEPAKDPTPPPKEGEAAAVAGTATTRATRNTGRRSTILTGESDSFESKISKLLGG